MSIQEHYRSRAKELLSAGTVKMVIGYGAGSTPDRRRPVFITSPDEADRLVLDTTCRTNLSGYLLREGLLSDQKQVAVFLTVDGIRSLNVLAAESQLDTSQVLVFGFGIEGDQARAIEGERAADFKSVIAAAKEQRKSQPADELQEKLEAMTPKERFSFWEGEFSRCIKCYACRQACPMCWCRRCVVDNNQPQWVNTSSHTLGNLEWNLLRAFHLAGRCVECGNCSRACPADIPLHLLNRRMADEVQASFDHYPGMDEAQEPVLASFRKDDPETFIL
ncbi:4Fe-4S dicluster domain-containing protein [Pelodictyon luteolum]|uniref:Hydrogenase, iron-sulfur binding protein, putative n=1 Tax=Chlorobium luteolum (strain DSM 273 / BCRC 81028 / 2530) TaxID=319225 RepID=Q3B3V8_CHLL3|nr:4Fe-4S dicluster domain-containing protein [Pelodictyon luteolum]ABB23973.1 hydrogenase, iron-sulfur binding protein, putative [Pelodictyon luteolum DSM 273]